MQTKVLSKRAAVLAVVVLLVIAFVAFFAVFAVPERSTEEANAYGYSMIYAGNPVPTNFRTGLTKSNLNQGKLNIVYLTSSTEAPVKINTINPTWQTPADTPSYYRYLYYADADIQANLDNDTTLKGSYKLANDYDEIDQYSIDYFAFYNDDYSIVNSFDHQGKLEDVAPNNQPTNYMRLEKTDTSNYYFIVYIRLERTNYSITFNKNTTDTVTGMPSTNPQSVTPNNSITLPTLSRTGYLFDGWYTSASGGTKRGAGGASYKPSATETLYAHWTLNTFTVTFDKRNGTGGSNSVTATGGAAMPAATMPTRTGYTFDGYYDATSGGTQYYTANGQSAKNWDKTANTTLYARWSVNQYQVSCPASSDHATYFISTNGTATSGSTSGQFNYGSTVYYFVVADEGYYAPNNSTWTQVGTTGDRIIYRAGSLNVGTGTNQFATVTPARGADISASVAGYDAPFDKGSHSVTVTVTAPAGCTVLYKVGNGQYGTNNPAYTNVGETTVFVKVTNVSGKYYPYTGSATVKITRQENVFYTTTPEVVEGLEYNGQAQALVTAGVSNYGTVRYKVGDNGNWSTSVPTAQNVNDYVVYYCVPADDNQVGIAESSFSVSIAEVNKDELIAIIDSAREFYNEEARAYPAIAEEFLAQIEEQEGIRDNKNVTVAQVAAAVDTMKGNLDVAKKDVTEARINSIFPLSCTDRCKAKIDKAKALYESLTVEQEALVSEEAKADLLRAERNYNAARPVKDLIDAIAPVECTDECGERIAAAMNGYNGLTSSQKALIPNYKTLVNANADYTPAKDAADKIDAIVDPVEYTDECKEAIDAAREAFDKLTEDQIALVGEEREQKLEDAEEAYAALKAADDEEKASNAKSLVNAISDPVEYTDECKEAIDAARDAFDNLSDDQIALLGDEYDELKERLEDAEEAYENLKAAYDEEKADNVKDLIDAIPDPVEYNDESKEAIDAARDAFDNLSDDQIALLGDEYDELKEALEEAEDDYAALKEDNDAADAVDALIDMIPDPVVYTPECKEAIDAARDAFDSLTEDQQALVEGAEDLIAAEEAYGALKAADDEEKADAVKDLIDAIPDPVEYTDECKEAIDAAREAFDALSEDQEALIDEESVEKLEDAEDAYNALKADHDAAEAVDALIDAIPDPVVYTPECKEAIDAARDAFDSLTDDQKALVDGSDDLIAAEEAYKALDDEAAADAVDALIDAIPDPVEYSDECKEKIDAARDAFDALDEDQQALVEGLDDLIAAEEAYDALKADHEAAEALKEYVNSLPDSVAYVEQKINEIFPLACNDSCKSRIDDARAVYDVLTPEQQELVNNKADLIRAENSYNAVKTVKDLIDAIAPVECTDECGERIAAAMNGYNGLTSSQKSLLPNYKALTQANADYTPAKDAADKIDAIPDPVEHTDECKEAIDAAREAFDSLSDDQKALVGEEREQKLKDAEEAYADQEVDQEAVDAVKDLINAIPDPVEYTDECKEAIDAARDAFDELNAAGQEAVGEELKQKLEDAEEAYDALEADHEAVDALKELIDAIPDPVEYTDECKEAIDAARDAFDELNAAQKDILGDDYDELEEELEGAEEAYNALKADHDAADAVKGLIDAIPDPVEYTDECKEAIDAARDAFDVLTDAQKDILGDDYDELEEELEGAEEAYNALKADHDAADAVKGLINAIGEVTYPGSGEAISTARNAFNGLTGNQKGLVDNEATLNAAENAYNALKTADDAAKADAVKGLINAIPDPVVYSDDCEEAIAAARDAFGKLTDEQKALLGEDNEKALKDAEDDYAALKADNDAAEAVKELIEAIGQVEDTEESKDKIDAAKEAYEALTPEQKALIEEEVSTTVTTAETTYETIHTNNLAAAEVMELISAIGKVEYTEESKEKIDAAKEAYEALTPEQKALVTEALTETVTTAETTYDDLGNRQKANEVKEMIVSIGEVKYPDSKEKIDTARDAYDGLTDPQKELVDNYDVLTEAEKTYDALETEANKKLSGGAIAGIVIGCVGFVAIVCFLILFLLKKKKDEEK